MLPLLLHANVQEESEKEPWDLEDEVLDSGTSAPPAPPAKPDVKRKTVWLYALPYLFSTYCCTFAPLLLIAVFSPNHCVLLYFRQIIAQYSSNTTAAPPSFLFVLNAYSQPKPNCNKCTERGNPDPKQAPRCPAPGQRSRGSR